MTLLKQTGFHVTNNLIGLLLIKALTGFSLTLQRTFLLIQILLSLKRIVNWRKNDRVIAAQNTGRFTHTFSTNRFTRGNNIATTMCFT